MFALFVYISPLCAETDKTAGPLDQQQIDAIAERVGDAIGRNQILINRLSDAVSSKLTRGAGPAASVAIPAAAGTERFDLAASAAEFAQKSWHVARSYPELAASSSRVWQLLDTSQRGRLLFLFLLALSGILGLGAERLIRWVIDGSRRRLISIEPTPGSSIALLAAVDFVPLLGLAAVSFGCVALWFQTSEPQSSLGADLIEALLTWRFYAYVFDIWFRPRCAAARIVPLDTTESRQLYRGVLWVTGVLVLTGTWVEILTENGTARTAIAAQLLINGIIIAGVCLGFVWVFRRPVAHWLDQLVDPLASFRGAKQTLARHWHLIATGLIVVLWVTGVYRAVAELMDAPGTITLTLNVIVVMVFLETLADFVMQRSDTRPVALHRDANHDVRRIMARIVRVAAYIAALVVVAEAWAVDMLGIVAQTTWRSTALEWVDIGATLFLAYVAWEAIEFVTGKYGGRPTIALQSDAASPEVPASRGVTLMPLVRIALLTIIVVAAVLVVLSELGANITPLIAGASIFGLAISFGSQALVRDIVSGVFYLAEDAFRIGEYIDCGKAKGTVEGFALRSLRLRHQNGQIHTLPFGQLGLITNYSRDWTTVKFALRFARTTDMEVLRKTTKRIGEEMMVAPEFANDFLEPLKMQGVADITDNAIVVRFKFTVRPTQPSTIQRDAVKRMMTTYRDAGISFADATVAVQTVQRADPASSAAAALSRDREKSGGSAQGLLSSTDST